MLRDTDVDSEKLCGNDHNRTEVGESMDPPTPATPQNKKEKKSTASLEVKDSKLLRERRSVASPLPPTQLAIEAIPAQFQQSPITNGQNHVLQSHNH